jgi:hypothetical protein
VIQERRTSEQKEAETPKSALLIWRLKIEGLLSIARSEIARIIDDCEGFSRQFVWQSKFRNLQQSFNLQSSNLHC